MIGGCKNKKCKKCEWDKICPHSFLEELTETNLELQAELKKDKEKEAHIKFEQTYKKQYLDEKDRADKLQAKLEKKDKIIDKMAEYIEKNVSVTVLYIDLKINSDELIRDGKKTIKKYFKESVENENK